VNLPAGNDLANLKQEMIREGKPYIALEPPGGTRIRIRFIGPYLGKEVIWESTLMTLEEFYCNLYGSTEQLTATPVKLRPFIDISRARGNSMLLTAVLNIGVLDEPAVQKTIIMIRNYKRLREGRHEFGEAREFKPR